MASRFSWSDTVKIAFNSCLPCLVHQNAQAGSSTDSLNNPTAHRIPRIRPDELHGLLREPSSDGDLEAETLSLHSNPGRRGKHKRSKKRGPDGTHPRRITLFGYSLFGRPPPIHLPDADDALFAADSTTCDTPTTTHTFDSDAAQLDADTIADFSSPASQARALEMEAARVAEKEARKQKRKERKEMQRLALALAAETFGGADGIQGLQGSGTDVPPSMPRYPRISNSAFSHHRATKSVSYLSNLEGFGPFVGSAPLSPNLHVVPQVAAEAEEEDVADLDGGLYARHASKSPLGSSHSRSRSQTSASTSDRGFFNHPDPRFLHHYQEQQQQQEFINDALSPSSPFSPSIPNTRKKKRTTTSSKSRSSATTSSSQNFSPSIASFPEDARLVSPSTLEHGLGFFDAEEPEALRELNPTKEVIYSPGLGRADGFPAVGFGVKGRKGGDRGALLARTGAGEEF